ncbi:MAG: efflux RND transporter periplasmic adaptor subunit [Desulfonatronovibrionaceae bacterium]
MMIKLLKTLFPIILLALGVWTASFFISQKTPPDRKPQPPRIPSVEVWPAATQSVRPAIQAMGTVVPAKEITLRSRVSGTVQQIHPDFTRGGILSSKETALTIDPSDYRIEAGRQESELTRALADLRLEQGRQDVARQELDMFTLDSRTEFQETHLALRRPQLDKARAAVRAARAGLDKARLDLARTDIKTPFNALILSTEINIGSQVSPNDSLATLAGTDHYYINASVPLSSLQFIDFSPENKTEVKVVFQNGQAVRNGRLLRLTGQVDEQTRMAGIVVQVKDPLGRKTHEPPLMLDEYVSLTIQGRMIKDVFPLPRKALRDRSKVWVFTEDGLDIRQTSSIWQDKDRVYVRKGLAPGDQVILSHLTLPVPGMKLKLAGQEKTP